MVKIKLALTENGNKVVTVKIADLRAFSIETNGNLPFTHSITRGSETEEDTAQILGEVKQYIKNFGTTAQKNAAKFLPSIVLIFALFAVSCSTTRQATATAKPVEFTHFYNWANNTESEPTAKDTVIFINLSNRQTQEAKEDGTQFLQDTEGETEAEVKNGKILSFTVFTSDSTGVTFFNLQNVKK